MRIAVALVVVVFLAPIAVSATIYVPDNYGTIQAAINASANGDTVVVRPGTYVENIDFVGKAIHLRSEQGPAVTTIDGNRAGSVVTFQSGEGTGSMLDGFSVTNGQADYGGGIYCNNYSSPTITGNIVTGNSGSYGVGIYCYNYSSPTITNNTISGNTAVFYGQGGGISCTDAISTIANNTITRNSAGYGGGIYCWNSSMTITNNIIAGNAAIDDGGGIYGSLSTTVTNCTLYRNSAKRNGGGIFFRKNSSFSTTAINCTFSGNSAASGGGIYCYSPSSPTVTNCIFWGDMPNELSGSSPNVTYSDIEGGYSGTGNIEVDPLFVNSVIGDLHLSWDSPCRNTGDNTVITELFDFEGDPRIHNGTVDMGADEYHTHLYHTGTVTPGSPIEVRVVGDPGSAPVTLALGSGIQDPPKTTPYGDLYLMLPLMWQRNLGTIPSNGVLVFPGTVPTSWQAGEEYPFQALLGPLVPGSVLTNLMVLAVE